MYCPLQQHYSTIFGCDFAPYILGIVHLLFIVVFGLTFIYISFPTTFFFDSFYTSHAVLFCSVSVVVSLLTLSMCFSLQFYVQDTDYNCRSYITYMLRREYVCVDIVYYNVCAQSLSHVWLSVTLWTGAPQAPWSMGFPGEEYCSGLPFPTPGDLPDPGIEPLSLTSPTLEGGFFTTSATWEAHAMLCTIFKWDLGLWSMSDNTELLHRFLLEVSSLVYELPWWSSS